MTTTKAIPERAITCGPYLTVPQPVKRFYNIAVGLTNFCPVRCAFCFMHAMPNKRQSISLGSEAIDRVLLFARENNVSVLDLSGGEALHELQSVVRIVLEAEVQRITITTSGYFATNESRTKEVLDELAGALEGRARMGKKPLTIDFWVSVDEYHARVPTKSINRIIELFEMYSGSKYKDIILELRGILMKSDPIPAIIGELRGKINEDPLDRNFPIKRAVLPSGYCFNVKYGEIKLLEEMLKSEMDNDGFDKVYTKRLNDDVIYIGRKKDGLSFSVSYDGAVSIQEYLVKTFPLGNAYDENFAQEIMRQFTTDPLVVALREIGLNTVLDVAARLRPNIRERSIRANNQFLAVSDILEDGELREYVYAELIDLIESRDGVTKRSNQPSDKAEISWIPLKTPQAIHHFDNILVALTNVCPVQCSFCFMQAVPDKRNMIVLSAAAIDKVLRFIEENSVPILDLTGGEAIIEMETVLKIVREAELQRISISTSGFFANSESRTEKVLSRLVSALRERARTGKKPIKIDFRVSVDEFHWHVTSKVLPHIVRAFEKYHDTEYKDIPLEIRSILSANDPFPSFIEAMGGEIKEDPSGGMFPLKQVILPSGYSFNIKYGEMKLIKDMLDTEVAETDFDKVYTRRLHQEVIYIGRGKQNGASFSVSHDGVVTLQEFLAREFALTNINNEDFFKEIERRLTLDPLIVALREIGLNTVLDIASRLRPNIRDRSFEANNQFMAVLDIVQDGELKDYVYHELIELIETRTDLGKRHSKIEAKKIWDGQDSQLNVVNR
jgi:MoaA/NifB/PqqE/SkfB family radical SAM enzyme